MFLGAVTLLSVPMLLEETDVLINRFDFSELQAGKSVCDRMAATVKANIRRYVNEDNNCETTAEFVQAARSTSYTTIAAGKITRSSTIEQKVQWPGIKQFNNVQYEIKKDPSTYGRSTETTFNIQATVWRAFGIGAGKQHQLQQKVINIDPIESVVEHNNNEWKPEVIPYNRKSTYQSFLSTFSKPIFSWKINETPVLTILLLKKRT